MTDCNAIISALNEELFVLYSFTSGRFYISEYGIVNRLNERGHGNRDVIKLETEELLTIEQQSIDSDKLDVDLFTSPLVVGIMVTNKCNLKCKYCIARQASSYSDSDRFDKYFHKLCSEIASSQILSVMLSGGEPTLNANLPQIIQRISNDHYLCLLDTNGTNLSNELICAINDTTIIPRISLDSIDPQVNNSCRGATDIVLNNIRLLLRNNIYPRINTVLTAANIDCVDSLAEWLISNGIKKWHIFKLQSLFAPEWLWITDESFVKTINRLREKYGEQIDILSKYGQEKDKYASFVIDAEGNCFSTNNLSQSCSKKTIFGNLESKTLYEIWNNCPPNYKRRHYKKYIYVSNEKRI